MTELSIPVALDPAGNPVPIEEAVRFKTDYYRCPKCTEIVNPRKGSVRAHFFAHKKGTLEETNCPLGTQADVDELIDSLRTSDVEETESARQIRVYFGETALGRQHLYGVIPSLDWDEFPSTVQRVDDEIAELEISASGLKRPPVPQDFHPTEPEVSFDLDPTSESFSVTIDGPDSLDQITGEWTADGFADGDLFLGDQSRARRHRQDRQIKEGEWVYLALTNLPGNMPGVVETETVADYTILSFPAREETRSLLENYGTGLTTDEYGFETDVILPSRAHPTSDAPLPTEPKADLLVGVTPAEDLDPVFEVVSIPKRKQDVVEIEPTGPGNPRFYASNSLDSGSRRISIHQRNSNRHRLIHTHADPEYSQTIHSIEPDQIGLQIVDDDTEIRLTPIEEDAVYTVSEDYAPPSLPATVEYTGPPGSDLEVIGYFPPDSPHGEQVHRTTTDLQALLPEAASWISQDCYRLTVHFDGLGTVSIMFPPLPSDANTPATREATQSHGDGQ
jgi:hypothetical protein